MINKQKGGEINMTYIIQAKIINYDQADWFTVVEFEKGEHDQYRNILNRYEAIKKEKNQGGALKFRLLEVKEV